MLNLLINKFAEFLSDILPLYAVLDKETNGFRGIYIGKKAARRYGRKMYRKYKEKNRICRIRFSNR